MAALNAYPVRAPQWQLIYQGVNISADVSRSVIGITYVDRLSENSGEAEVTLEDHNKLWQGAWYPQQGDVVSLTIGYHNEAALTCGDFQVDEIECEGPPDQMTLRCIAAWITPSMRSPRSVAYESVTLPQLAATIAGKYQLTVVGAPALLDVRFQRITQRHETDLEFLRRVAWGHGYSFTVRGRQLVFYSIASLEGAASTRTLKRADVLSFSFINKSHRTYKAAQVSYQAPATKQLLTQGVSANPAPEVGDTLRVLARCESNEQALLKAESALHTNNMLKVVARLEMPGTTDLLAGSIATIADFGANDGTYLIEDARHRIGRDNGYTTNLAARRIGD